jgi:hypothetical protein
VRLLAIDNYPDWSTTSTNFLKADRTWKIIQGIEKLPTPPALAPQSEPLSRTRSQEPSEDELVYHRLRL